MPEKKESKRPRNEKREKCVKKEKSKLSRHEGEQKTSSLSSTDRIYTVY